MPAFGPNKRPRVAAARRGEGEGGFLALALDFGFGMFLPVTLAKVTPASVGLVAGGGGADLEAGGGAGLDEEPC